jgi:hypothetical protein
MGFEPTIPVLERVKTVHYLDRTGTEVGYLRAYPKYMAVTLICSAQMMKFL